MSLNNIDLPGVVIADLYKTIQAGSEKSSAASTATAIDKHRPHTEVEAGLQGAHWKFLGNNGKNVTIITNQKTAVYLPDDELTFLTGILGACKLSIADVAILNLNNYESISYKELLTHLESKTVLLFGVDPVAFGLPLSFPYFQVQAFANASFLYSPSLRELQTDKVLKSKLWVCLRRIFGI